jgi:hypothetical protein
MENKQSLITLDSSFSQSVAEIFDSVIDQAKLIALASIRGIGRSIEPVLNSLKESNLIHTLKNPNAKGFSDASTTAGLVASTAATLGGSVALATGAGIVTGLYVLDNIIDSYQELQKENRDLSDFYELASAEVKSVSKSLDQPEPANI